MSTALERFQEKSETLKDKIIEKYSYNKKMARSFIAAAELNADYRMQENDLEERWYIYFIEELEKRL